MKIFKQKQMNPKPLEGMLVVAIVDHVAGPVAAKQLALLGATVFKIEPVKGDPARIYLHSALFEQLNQGLLSVVMDEDIYPQLLEKADVIIDNRTQGAKNKDKHLQQALINLNQHKVYCSITGFGGKFDLPAMDVIIQAESGIAYTNAFSREQPLKVGYTLADINSGKTAALHIISTWVGLKCHPDHYKDYLIKLEISLFAELLNQQFGQVVQSVINEENNLSDQVRSGNEDMFLSPFSFYLTKDLKYIAIAVGSHAHFSRLCEAIDKPVWLSLYPDNKDRVLNKKFNDEFSSLIKEKSAEEWMTILTNINIPCGRVNTIREAVHSAYASPYLFKNNKTQYPVVSDSCKNSADVIQIETTLLAPKLNEHAGFAANYLEKLRAKETLKARL